MEEDDKNGPLARDSTPGREDTTKKERFPENSKNVLAQTVELNARGTFCLYDYVFNISAI